MCFVIETIMKHFSSAFLFLNEASLMKKLASSMMSNIKERLKVPSIRLTSEEEKKDLREL